MLPKRLGEASTGAVNCAQRDRACPGLQGRPPRFSTPQVTYGSLTMNMPATTTKLLTLATISMSLQVRGVLLLGLRPTFPLYVGWPGQGEDERGPVLGGGA